MTEPHDDLVRHRLQRAEETLEEARILSEAGRWRGYVNRLYYACFYAVSALLLKHGLTSSKHTGVRSLFNLHFVKTGRVAPKLGQFYNELFQHRQEGDYMDTVNFEEQGVQPWLGFAEEFVEEVARLSLAG